MRSILPIPADSHPYADLGILDASGTLGPHRCQSTTPVAATGLFIFGRAKIAIQPSPSSPELRSS